MEGNLDLLEQIPHDLPWSEADHEFHMRIATLAATLP